MLKGTLVLLSGFGLLWLALVSPIITQGQPEITATVKPPVEVASEMDSVPSYCGILAESMQVDPQITAIGTWPIWIALPNMSDETRGVLVIPNEHYQINPQLEGWWATKVAAFIPITYKGKVQLKGVNVADNSPMYFEFGADGPTTIATLDPDHPGGSASGIERWAFFPSYFWVSKAGCYRLEAVWDGGAWQQIIAVGSTE